MKQNIDELKQLLGQLVDEGPAPAIWQPYRVTCGACGVAFRASSLKAKFCSDRCRQRAHRKGDAIQREVRHD
jgi:hypothetical protein